MKIRKFVLLSIIVGVLLILFLIQYFLLKKEGFISRENKDKITKILNNPGFSYSDKISNIKNLKLNDDAINDIIFKNEKSLLQLINEYVNSKYSKLTKKNNEDIQKILNKGNISFIGKNLNKGNTSFSRKKSNIKNLKINNNNLNKDYISFSQKISNIKNLKINDKTLNDLIFNNEKITIQLITDYMNTNIPEELKL